jgi:hypothetical protein
VTQPRRGQTAPQANAPQPKARPAKAQPAKAPPGQPPDATDTFLQLSIILTGFDESDLRGTGMLQTYYDELLRIIGAREAGELFGAFEPIAHPNHRAFDRKTFRHDMFKEDVFDDQRFGPVARNVLRMWYMAIWKQLPREWRDEYGATSYDTDHVVSAAAYRESLVWPAAGTHPMGAKAPGFGTWAKASALPRAKRNRP